MCVGLQPQCSRTPSEVGVQEPWSRGPGSSRPREIGNVWGQYHALGEARRVHGHVCVCVVGGGAAAQCSRTPSGVGVQEPWSPGNRGAEEPWSLRNRRHGHVWGAACRAAVNPRSRWECVGDGTGVIAEARRVHANVWGLQPHALGLAVQ